MQVCVQENIFTCVYLTVLVQGDGLVDSFTSAEVQSTNIAFIVSKGHGPETDQISYFVSESQRDRTDLPTKFGVEDSGSLP